MELERYQDLARRTQNQTLTLAQKRMHALHGLASEVGEIHGIYQKTFQGHALRSEDVIDELGDLLWFTAELADVLGVSLDEVARRNVDKLMKRYPEGFEEVRSLNRDPTAEEKKWALAECYLNQVMTEYAAIGGPGRFALDMLLVPLKKRLDEGERTEELYAAIMECE